MAALTGMRQRDRGTIVQVGSALAYRAIPLQEAYGGAKHALRGFTDSLRCELMNERSNVSITKHRRVLLSCAAAAGIAMALSSKKLPG
jgi:short-subunit dehydrogenase